MEIHNTERITELEKTVKDLTLRIDQLERRYSRDRQHDFDMKIMESGCKYQEALRAPKQGFKLNMR